jgi:hypothetical protein
MEEVTVERGRDERKHGSLWVRKFQGLPSIIYSHLGESLRQAAQGFGLSS